MNGRFESKRPRTCSAGEEGWLTAALNRLQSAAVLGGHTAHKLMIKLKSLLHLLSPTLTLRVYPWFYLGFSDEMALLASGAFASRLNVFILTK
jgi:hypothetical protein